MENITKIKKEYDGLVTKKHLNNEESHRFIKLSSILSKQRLKRIKKLAKSINEIANEISTI